MPGAARRFHSGLMRSPRRSRSRACTVRTEHVAPQERKMSATLLRSVPSALGIPSTSCADAHVATRIARRPIHGPRAHSLAKQAAVAALPNAPPSPLRTGRGRGPKGEFQSSPVQSSPAPHSPAPSFPLSLRLLSPFFSPPHPVNETVLWPSSSPVPSSSPRLAPGGRAAHLRFSHCPLPPLPLDPLSSYCPSPPLLHSPPRPPPFPPSPPLPSAAVSDPKFLTCLGPAGLERSLLAPAETLFSSPAAQPCQDST